MLRDSALAHRLRALLGSPGETGPTARRRLLRDALLALVLWGLGMLLLLPAENGPLLLFWFLLLVSGQLLHRLSSIILIPSVWGRRRAWWHYLWRYALVIVGTAWVLGVFIGAVLLQDGEAGVGYACAYLAFHLGLTGQLSWLLFRWRNREQQALEGLQQELGQSEASLDLLRSQINPHFLFNVLNTLYGTALQENADRTAQGIQMLGDMMRFMLHENHQPRILLAREIEYLRNYIELQSLRTATSPDISLETHLAEVPTGEYIAPMLLIPFVENAFKHGISLQRKSWIKTTLHCEGRRLYFDVYNSTHPRREGERMPEDSGIGLANVRQRLQLLYPGRHELVIRETLGEYFVHLTLEL
ncbi:hypothetical protein EJV47_11830 [Hymenobacter gummosus]|uniref:Signal transduction histidine kinase internal region domain-containing protein n=1 Tax=Hymenobacter gummosus TaxID=1776032 RepID=A0A431U472_9BACT|nr:histidine kinase [Hymenobacter gummosus]RTQ50307.1 hypothetical protein EJV47_11830 [Hymenobacter gummosus]